MTSLGTLPGGTFTVARGISSNGLITGYGDTASGTVSAFLWTGGALLAVGPSGSPLSLGMGVNPSGSVAGYSFAPDFSLFSALLYGGSGLFTIPALGGLNYAATGNNAAGMVVGYSEDSGGTDLAFQYSQGVLIGLGTLPGGSTSRAIAINGSGQIAGVADMLSGNTHAFRNCFGVWTDLGLLTSFANSEATAIADSGAVAGMLSTDTLTRTAFLWTQSGGVWPLGTLGGDSAAFGVNSSNWVVGTSNGHAFLWANATLYDLNNLLDNSGAGWQLQEAFGVNDLGQIVGTGLFNGELRGFLLDLSNTAPAIVSISRLSAVAGGAGFALTVNGSGFVSTSVVDWGGSARATTYISPTQLQAAILSGDIALAGNIAVTVFTPAPGGGLSGSASFTVNAGNNPVPAIATISPASLAAGSGGFTLTVNGSGFVPASVVNWNGSARATTYLGATQLQAAIFASDVNGPGTAQVTVFNPVSGLSGNSPFTIFASGQTGLQFYPMTPCRIMDTRVGSGYTGSYGPPSLTANVRRDIPILASCGLPSNAAVYSLNLTVIPQQPLNSLVAWPAGQPQPRTVNLYSTDGSVLADAAMVQGGAGGAISVVATGNTDLVIDINGYFAPPSASSLQFFPMSPCRVIDTRYANGVFGTPNLAMNVPRDFPFLQSSCGILNLARAYSVNVTVVPKGTLWYVQAGPAGQPLPFVSTLNDYSGAGVPLANAAIVPAGTNGAVTFNGSQDTDLIVDINGYFAPPASGGLNYYPVAPCRAADTRNAAGLLGGPILTGYAPTSRSFPLAQSGCGLPSTAGAYSLNISAMPTAGLWYLTAWATGQATPFVSTLNDYKGVPVANAALAPAGTGGAVSVLVSQDSHVVLDVNGYFGQ